jgi:hypothetical protein
MAGVYYCSDFNSTHFTRCCNVAILPNEQKCPQCKKDVYPFNETMSRKERDNYGPSATHRVRSQYCRQYK